MTQATRYNSTAGGLTFENLPQDSLLIKLSGSWKLDNDLPSASEVEKRLETGPSVRQIRFDAGELQEWDSGLLTFLTKIRDLSKQKTVRLDHDGLPEGARRLLLLASAVPEKKDTGKDHVREPVLTRIGSLVIEAGRSSKDMLAFIGDATLAFLKFLGGRARFRRSDLILIIQECGVDALPIVSLISVLIGLILAFMGAVQLKLFGAEIYIASLVAIGMTREMGAMMAAIIMSGRTGAAFAAQLGTMQVNEEIDALKTMGVAEFLVLPRLLALVLMMPLLCIYADLVGIIGGFIVGVGAFDITYTQYLEQTILALNLRHILIGVVKSGVFGVLIAVSGCLRGMQCGRSATEVLIAVSGCLRGMQCGRSATEVGYAATSAVVTAIVWIIVTDGLFAVITNVLKI
jgi:phospholipid/cholesterol/gamma-HCH transport system permease protein